MNSFLRKVPARGLFYFLINYNSFAILSDMKEKPKSDSQKVLYRKYRPLTFADVIGQDHIVEVLQTAIKQDNISHAYLLTGSRGTGKTTIARIIANVLETSPNDLYEIDAASNRGIDNIRELRENVNTLPFDSKYKVYIVDEVHMLTKEAFNALLKTLEEPPSHVIFILATTELEKVPETIVSRCQTFVFKKPNIQILKKVVESIAKKEGFSIDDEGAELIALLGDGSFRDTEGTLEKIISFTQSKKITLEEIERITGAPRRKLVREYILGILSANIEIGMKAVKQIVEQNSDTKLFATLVLELFRALLLSRVAPDVFEKEMNLNDEDQAFIKDMVGKYKEKITSQTLYRLLTMHEETRNAFISQLPLELALIDLVENK